MSLIRFYAQDILSELNQAALAVALGKATRRIAVQGGVLGLVALMFWVAAMLTGPIHAIASLILLMLSFGLTCAMLQSAASQIALGRSLLKDPQ